MISNQETLYSPDKVIVKLKEKAAPTVSTDISGKPFRYIKNNVTQFGISSLDKVSSTIGTTGIRRIGTPTLIYSDYEEVREMPDIEGLNRTYSMVIQNSVDVAEAVNALKKDPNVEDAEPNYLATTSIIPNDSKYPQQWALPRINCPSGWEKMKGSPQVKVAVIDTGVDLDHPDLKCNLIKGYDWVDVGTPPLGWHWVGDYTGVDNIPDDERGHGTHVSGTIAACTNNGLGVSGVAWHCKIMPVRALGTLANNNNPNWKRGSGEYDDIASAIKWAADKGAHVINMSLGGPKSFVLKGAIDYAFKKNCVLVAAMGNDGDGTIQYPASYSNVLAVGATDITDTRASFSNYSVHNDVVAPGVNILSTVPNDSYAVYQGTSMATPHVSGLAALLKSCNMNASNTQIMDRIKKTATPLGTPPYPNHEYGHGLINVKAALADCEPTLEIPVWKRLCQRYPWLPWCKICRVFPWFCDRIFGSEASPEELSEFMGLFSPSVLKGSEQELEQALDMMRSMNHVSDCGCNKTPRKKE